MMTNNEKRQIWVERSEGVSVERIARRHNRSDAEIRAVLDEAPSRYKQEYNNASNLSETAFKALPPKRPGK